MVEKLLKKILGIAEPQGHVTLLYPRRPGGVLQQKTTSEVGQLRSQRKRL